ncbi:MAG: glycosyltransferase family 2 protein [Oscillospiraceae bacterium]|nr:glycosyltransferase family 2 protein [Oscillospiraceae bacterium]
MNKLKYLPLVSLIIPVYNVEAYIEDCLESVLLSTYNNIEIILVDDGSTDNSGNICDQYKDKDSRIKVIHKNNGGLSDARNVGLQYALGEYISYVDSDDVVAPKYIEHMVELALKYQADIVQVSYTKEKDELTMNPCNSNVKVFTKAKAMKNLLMMKDIKEASCVKLYKKELANHIHFPVGRLYEDVLTAYQFVYYSNKVVCDTCSKLYYYRINEAGIMHKKLTLERFSVLTVIQDIKLFLDNDLKKYQSEWSYYSMRHMINVYNECIERKYDIEFISIMSKIRKSLIQNSNDALWFDMKYKSLIWLLSISPVAYKKFVLALRSAWK